MIKLKDGVNLKGKVIQVVLLVLVFTTLITGCVPSNTNTTKLEKELKEKDARINELESEKKALEDRIVSFESGLGVKSPNSLLPRVIETIGLIKAKDMKSLSSYVHPTNGLRFSPYPYVDTKTDQVFTAQQVAGLVQDTKEYLWGHYDGSGEPIKLSFNNYYDKFIYDVDFANPHMIGNNVAIGKGNSIDNVKQAYPKGYFVEFYFTGFEPQYEGMDWRSLKLVFEDVNGVWYLVGIIHGQWTI